MNDIDQEITKLRSNIKNRKASLPYCERGFRDEKRVIQKMESKLNKLIKQKGQSNA